MSALIFSPIPLETAKAALDIYGRSNFYLVVGDHADQLFDGLTLEDQSGRFGKPVRTMALLYLITVFQYIETLPDNQAADALRQRIDWKYALHLPVSYPGMQGENFCQFRRWLLLKQAGMENLQTLLSRIADTDEFNCSIQPGTQSQQAIFAVCQCSRIARVREVFTRALEALAIRRPDLLLAISLPHWYERYGNGKKYINLKVSKVEQQAMALAVGVDGKYLLSEVSTIGDAKLTNLHEIQELDLTWEDQFLVSRGELVWRKDLCDSCSNSSIDSYQSV